MASIKITLDDGGDSERLARAFEAAAHEINPEVEKVVSRAALNIKQDWAKTWSGHPTYPYLGAAVTYDLSRGGMGISAEIGPDKNRTQGALGNILEFGTSRNSPNPGGGPALNREGPRFVKALEDVAEKVID